LLRRTDVLEPSDIFKFSILNDFYEFAKVGNLFELCFKYADYLLYCLHFEIGSVGDFFG
jgi:hypothetical protein